MAHHLGGAGFAGEVDAFQMRGAGGVVEGGHCHLCHAVGDDLPVFGIDGNVDFARTGIGVLQGATKIFGQLIGEDRVRADKMTSGGDAADDASELDRRGFDGALADGNVERLIGVPAVVIGLHQPLRGWHQAGLLAGQIDAGFFSVAEFFRVLGDAVDAKLVAKLVVVGVAGIRNGIVNIDRAVLLIAVMEEPVGSPAAVADRL